jgi:2-polyprenyl-3-methyl-5-hydroxy-6-metoxy-1,4-benzoquinol methylase
MGIAYRLMYAVGFTPWDGPVPNPLKDMIEGPNAVAAAWALDLGCGKGTKSVYMATHGWGVTGVDFVPRALNEARRRAQDAGVKIDFRQGDVTKLADLGLTPG